MKKGSHVPGSKESQKPVLKKDVKRKYFPYVPGKLGRKSREVLLEEAHEREVAGILLRITEKGELYVKKPVEEGGDGEFHRVRHKEIMARMNAQGKYSFNEQDFKIYLGRLIGMTQEEAAVWSGVKTTGKSKSVVRSLAYKSLKKNDDIKEFFRRVFHRKGITLERIIDIYDSLLIKHGPKMDEVKNAKLVLDVTDRVLELQGYGPQKSINIESKQTLDVRQILLQGSLDREKVRAVAEECRDGLGIPPGVDFLQGMGDLRALPEPGVVDAEYKVEEAG